MQPQSFSQIPPARPKNWLVESILVTLFCCLPFGIAGIVYASSVNSKYDIGDYEGAAIASKEAGKWTKVAFFVGIGVGVVYLLLMVLGVSSALLGHHV